MCRIPSSRITSKRPPTTWPLGSPNSTSSGALSSKSANDTQRYVTKPTQNVSYAAFQVFVEYFPESRPFKPFEDVAEYFLGICDLKTLSVWNFCSATLRDIRPSACIFDGGSTSSGKKQRVKRLLCDVSQIASHGHVCNCSYIGQQKLYQVDGNDIWEYDLVDLQMMSHRFSNLLLPSDASKYMWAFQCLRSDEL